MSFGESFLRQPDLFPARRAGESWGAEEVRIDLAGGPYLFNGLDPVQKRALRRRFGGIRRPAPGTDPAVEIRIFRAPTGEFLELDTRGWEYRLDLDYAPDSVRCAGLQVMGRLHWSAVGTTGALWTSAGEGEHFLGAVENFFRIAVAYRLAATGGALLHCACAIDRGSAILFVGPSGAGKTTVARISQRAGRELLSDDLNGIAGPAAALRVEPLPFGGDLGPPTGTEPVPLGAVVRLRKSEKNGLRGVGPAAALAWLAAAAPYVNRDPYRGDRLLGNLERIASSVPLGELCFSRRGGFWTLLRRLREKR